MVDKKVFPNQFESTFPKVFKIIQQMIEYEPTRRPTVEEVERLFRECGNSGMFIPICDDH